MPYVIASSRLGYEQITNEIAQLTGDEFYLIDNKEDLNLNVLREINPTYVFLPHWSYIVPKDVYEAYECIIFHMTDLPFGRGGSPLQNLISRGIYETKVSALQCSEGIDTGPIYVKRNLSLYGSAEEIYLRASKLITEMILYIIGNSPIPIEQEGEPVCFKRRRPEEGNIDDLKSLEEVYDYIRMLDAEGYPHAFFETKHLRMEFRRASLKQDCIHADVIITKKEDK
ncbi:MAG: methionyl-tRNA formyltransferase [Desulfosporosinus sp. BRH_c37]|nr:MAG: methionyl-tRNA formyltransferase [Desulfosporosinus sp. BRH_c37]